MLENQPTSWTALPDAVRLEPSTDVPAVAVPLRRLVERTPTAGQPDEQRPDLLIVPTTMFCSQPTYRPKCSTRHVPTAPPYSGPLPRPVRWTPAQAEHRVRFRCPATWGVSHTETVTSGPRLLLEIKSIDKPEERRGFPKRRLEIRQMLSLVFEGGIRQASAGRSRRAMPRAPTCAKCTTTAAARPPGGFPMPRPSPLVSVACWRSRGSTSPRSGATSRSGFRGPPDAGLVFARSMIRPGWRW
ncbi:hypothetical protein BZB76_2796 [Actinomadura pelletieri DSM 43383]|uniref:Uncharacterized protein n=1 Tax=Actinomadura pelletieri DSM 43383 TaxID=1120940 RepID=A0A495QMY0_9ACTN|nr:hypothetical protein BZB76_2796 [Actinomadura pelletieri DSM 43383]